MMKNKVHKMFETECVHVANKDEAKKLRVK